MVVVESAGLLIGNGRWDSDIIDPALSSILSRIKISSCVPCFLGGGSDAIATLDESTLEVPSTSRNKMCFTAGACLMRYREDDLRLRILVEDGVRRSVFSCSRVDLV